MLRGAEEAALAELDPDPLERLGLLLGLDPLGHEATAGGLGEVAHPDHQGLPGKVGVDASHQCRIELHEIGIRRLGRYVACRIGDFATIAYPGPRLGSHARAHKEQLR